jgi:arsenate reductase
MKEDGIDISNHTSKTIVQLLNSSPFNGVVRDGAFDYIITVCDNAKENCPYFPSKAKRFHQNFPDPAKATGSEEEILQEFRKVRDMLKEYSQNFIKQINFQSV